MERRTAIYNTYFAIVASTVAAFAISAASSRDGKLNMVSGQSPPFVFIDRLTPKQSCCHWRLL